MYQSKQNTITISNEQIGQYQEQGYLFLGKVLDDKTLEAFRNEEYRFRSHHGDLDAGEKTLFYNQVTFFSEAVRHFSIAGPQVEAMKQIVDPNLALWFTQFVTKNPDGNSQKSEFPWHQDNGYVSIEKPTNATLWIALDDVDEENGCVWVVPGSHKNGLLDHSQKSAGSWHLSLDVESDGIPCPMKAGEAVVFTGLTLHRSKLNHTDHPRRAFFLEYCELDSTYSTSEGERKRVIESPDTIAVCGETSLALRK